MLTRRAATRAGDGPEGLALLTFFFQRPLPGRHALPQPDETLFCERQVVGSDLFRGRLHPATRKGDSKWAPDDGLRSDEGPCNCLLLSMCGSHIDTTNECAAMAQSRHRVARRSLSMRVLRTCATSRDFLPSFSKHKAKMQDVVHRRRRLGR